MSEITFYVNTNSAGGDGTTNGTTGTTAAYASGAVFLAAEAADLPSDGNNYLILMDGAGGNDTTQMDVDGFTTGDGYGLLFRQNPAGSPYSLKYADAAAPLILRSEYVEFDGIEIFNTHSSSERAIDFTDSRLSGDNLTVIKNCHVGSNFDKSNGYLIEGSESNLIAHFINMTAACSTRFMDVRQAAQIDIDYCSILIHGNYLGLVAGEETTTRNTYIGHTGTDTSECFWTGKNPPPTGSNNVSSDASATTDYTSSLINKEASDQFVSVTSGSEDFALKTGTPAIEGAATPIASITTDQIGTTRDATTPDVGARERVGGGGGTTVVMTISESIAGVDAESAKAGFVSSISESLASADTSTGRLSAVLSVSESAGASDIDQGQYATSQEMIEAVQANDLTTSLFKGLLTQSLSALARDAVSFTTPGIILTIGETIASSDNLSISANFKMTIGESANLTDSASSRASLISSIAESISGSDRFNRSSAFSLTISESVIATDLMSVLNPNLLGQITATISIDPLIGGTINLIPTITGTIKVT
jgi:hypothetical protein